MTDNLLATTAETNPSQELDPNKNYLDELVGENKKFKTNEHLARGKYEADQYIEILKKRQDELRDDYLKLREEHMARSKLEDLVNQLRQQQISSNTNTEVKEVSEKPVIDPKEIENLVSNKIQEHEVSKKQQENFNLVKVKLEEKFGINYQTALKKQADLLGLSDEDINALARKAPKAFFKTLGLEGETVVDKFQPPVRSNQRSDSFAPTTQKRTWAYYQNLKKVDPKSWLDPKTATQMQRDAIDLGDDFKDGDYNKYN